MPTCNKCGGTGQVPDDAKIGKTIRKLREKKQISVRGMAKRIGISAPFLSDMELGRRHWGKWEAVVMEELK